MMPTTAVIPRKYSVNLNGRVIPCIEYSNPEVMAQTPLVSIAMVTYNHEQYIAQAIESVAMQETEFPIELIIGEDCSTDCTREIVFEYQRKYPKVIRVITSERNVGMRRNCMRVNAGARGKYIAYGDGDDYWHNRRKLQMQVDYLECHPECGMVHTNADSYHVLSGRRMPMAIPYRPELCDSDDPFLQQLTGACAIWPLTVCIRKELLDQITRECPEITDERFMMGDTPRFLEIAHRSAVHYMPISTATRNLLPESATQSQSIARKGKFIASSAEMTLHYLEKYPVPEQYDRQIRRWVYLRELEYAYLCRDADRARRALVALKEKRIPVPLQHWLHYIGALNPVTHILIRGHFAMMNAAVAIRHALVPSRVGRS